MDPCGAIEARCRCVLEIGHSDAAHVCECGGSWEPSGNDLIIRAVPGSAPGWPTPPPMVDPFIAAVLAGPPMQAPRGGITFLPPPEQ